MKGVCPGCEKITELEHIITTEEFNIRGELISVKSQYYKCKECGEEFEDPGSKDDPLDKAYREYRRKRGMVQPEEIREMRKRYSLTQKELSNLIGWGGATLSRYENGAIQDIEFKEYLGEKYFSDDEPDLNVFSEDELEILIYVKKYFKDHTATQIREYSHDEKGYKETRVGEIISYEYASHLQI
jgi:putative zinc finger/helix-turn-helix YgiT family protein